MAGLFPAVRCAENFLGLLLSILPDIKPRGPREPPLESSPNSSNSLEVELQSELHKSRITGSLHAAKVRPVRDISIGLEELGVVERIEQLSVEFEPDSFADRNLLLETKLPVIQTRAAADGAGRISDGARCDGVIRKGVGVESGIDQGAGSGVSSRAGSASQFPRIDGLERRGDIWLTRRFEIEAALQFNVVLRGDANRESGLERGDTGNRPAIQNSPLESLILWHSQFPIAAEGETVPRIKKRQGTVAHGVNGVNQALVGGSIVEELAEA